MRIAAGLLVFVATISATTASAQSSASLRLSDGRTVEVIGLRRWSLAMLQDSLARYAPGDSLQSHACAATLRYRLGFADAASTTYDIEGEPERVVVSVREPQDSARVKYRLLPLDTTTGRPDWLPVSGIVSKRPAVFWPTLRAFLDGSPLPRFRNASDSASGAAMLAFLRAATTDAHRRDAREALARSPKLYDRATAALILGNFTDRDDTWWALADALRESEGFAKNVAEEVLQARARRSPRKVEWSPAAPGIHAMLDGTSLFTVPTIIEVLTSTGAGPRDARAFLRGGGEMLLAYLGSETSMLSGGAHALLVKLRGADLGTKPGPWKAWIDSL